MRDTIKIVFSGSAFLAPDTEYNDFNLVYKGLIPRLEQSGMFLPHTVGGVDSHHYGQNSGCNYCDAYFTGEGDIEEALRNIFPNTEKIAYEIRRHDRKSYYPTFLVIGRECS
ncbi:MAG: hypothetical protein LRY54_00940 [Alphaproteobacteria bacterium]|nr:hypothetical protein [Alphaproteobacteria bacterium]